jgi:Uma2 family endonuclease
MIQIDMAVRPEIHRFTVDDYRRMAEAGILGEDERVELMLDPHTEVQPDIALVHARDDFYAASHPGPKDLVLVIEVTETSMTYDRSVKLPLYARAGVAEVWLVDLSEECVDVHRGPTPNGYQEVTGARGGDRLSPAQAPRMELEASSVLV